MKYLEYDTRKTREEIGAVREAMKEDWHPDFIFLITAGLIAGIMVGLYVYGGPESGISRESCVLGGGGVAVCYAAYELWRMVVRRAYAFGLKGVARFYYVLGWHVGTTYHMYDEMDGPEFRIMHRKDHGYTFIVDFRKKGFEFSYEWPKWRRKFEFRQDVAHALHRHLTRFRTGEASDYSEDELKKTIEIEHIEVSSD